MKNSMETLFVLVPLATSDLCSFVLARSDLSLAVYMMLSADLMTSHGGLHEAKLKNIY